MKKTSRRSFGKSVAAALAAIPVATLGSESNLKAQKRRRSSVLLDDARSHENTPPPIELLDGSFSILMKTNSATAPLSQSGSGLEYTYKGKVAPSTKNSFEHIKVIHGSGEQVYRDLDASDSIVTVKLLDENDDNVGDLIFSCVNDEIKIKSIGYGSGPANGQLQPSYKAGRPYHKHSLTHQGGPGNKEFRVAAISVTKRGAMPLDFVLPPVSANSPFESQGFRILLWLKE